MNAKNVAIEAVEQGNQQWVDETLRLVVRVALSKRAFTTDDVWHLQPEMPREPRAMGAVMVRARKAGYVECTDRTLESDRESCHHRPLRVWRSLICDSF
jgi:hypothetical protein